MSVRELNVMLQHSMKVVFLCNRLSRTKLRGSWQALLEAAGPGAGAGASEETSPGSEPGTSANTVKGNMEVSLGVVVVGGGEVGGIIVR